MAGILDRDRLGRPLSRLENVTCRPAKADLKTIEMVWRQRVGSALGAAFRAAGLSQKEVAAACERNQAQVARWVSGVENPPVAALLAIDVLRAPIVIAFAGLSQDIEITTTLSIRRPA